MRAGVPIEDLNAVRSCVDTIKAGGLLGGVRAQRVSVLVLSDVCNAGPEAVSSGFAIPSRPDFERAFEIVRGAGLDTSLIAAAQAAPAIYGGFEQSVRPDVLVVGGCMHAVRAAAACAKELGFQTEHDERPYSGEARAIGSALAARALAVPSTRRPRAILRGGETTVTLRAGEQFGRGGRNQEAALAAAEVLSDGGEREAVLVAGTDGIDGPTDAAGGLVDGRTWSAISAAGVDPGLALREHDSGPALEAGGGLFVTGPTGTNVNDIAVALAYADEGVGP